MPEVWFYHLVRQPLDKVLPVLLEKAVARGIRICVQVGDPARVEALDDKLWTWSDESFIPHGAASDGDSDMQPVYLTTGDENPNNAVMRIFADGARATDAAESGAAAGYDRLILMLDGANEDAVADARAQWKWFKEAGYTLSYWQQNENGGWEKKAEHKPS
ncbi:MAG: DNA polymerase III subunit chi [Beijerinckiaceae bacterium]|nr:DNA polymerase III subunit chi [Beijerinckiaceae bacterium]